MSEVATILEHGTMIASRWFTLLMERRLDIGLLVMATSGEVYIVLNRDRGKGRSASRDHPVCFHHDPSASVLLQACQI